MLYDGSFSSKKSIAFIGYRATGKTTVGKMLALRLGWVFLDMDDLLVNRFGMTIKQWVEKYGWESFRFQEARLLREISLRSKIVLATGGGVVEKSENLEILKKNFFVIWLSCSVEEIVKRLAKDEKSIDNRPSLTGQGLLEEVQSVLDRREPLYREVSDVEISVDNKTPETIEQIVFRSIPSYLIR